MIEEVEKLTKEQLEQYTSIKEEIKELEAELDKKKISCVRYRHRINGRLSLYTAQYYYTGIIERYIFSRFETNLQKNSTGTAEGRNRKFFLDSVQDSKIRRIIRLKYIKGNT